MPNSSGVPNKCMVAYNFFDLLHKNARFWSFLAYFWFKINSRGATTIRQCRVQWYTYLVLGVDVIEVDVKDRQLLTNSSSEFVKSTKSATVSGSTVVTFTTFLKKRLT